MQQDYRHRAWCRPPTIWALAVLCSLASSSTVRAVDLIGYLPYYRMNGSYNANMLPGQLALLDEIRYFGLTINSSGVITTLDGASVASHTNRIATIKQAIQALPESNRPRLNITFGGAGEDLPYQTVAASASLRETMAQNIASLLNSTGATSVDIDWEHPSNSANAAGVAERNNYSLMVQRIKQEIGSERRVYATMTPEIFMPASAFQGANAIDGVSLMTYDLNWWGNDPANPLTGEHSVPDYVADSVEAWTEPAGSGNDRPWVFPRWGNNAPEDKLGVGLPFYGKNINTAAAYTYAEMVAGGTTTDGNYYNYAGGAVWIPGPELVEQRVQYAHDQDLQHVIIWEVGQDLNPSNPNSLLRRAYDKRESLIPVAIPGDYDGNGSVGVEDYNLWKSTYGASAGDMRADGNEDGTIDTGDYTFWRDRVAASGVGAATGVPEPVSAILLGMHGIVAVLIHRQRGI
jgi:hypothetical protein